MRFFCGMCVCGVAARQTSTVVCCNIFIALKDIEKQIVSKKESNQCYLWKQFNISNISDTAKLHAVIKHFDVVCVYARIKFTGNWGTYMWYDMILIYYESLLEITYVEKYTL